MANFNTVLNTKWLKSMAPFFGAALGWLLLPALSLAGLQLLFWVGIPWNIQGAVASRSGLGLDALRWNIWTFHSNLGAVLGAVTGLSTILIWSDGAKRERQRWLRIYVFIELMLLAHWRSSLYGLTPRNQSAVFFLSCITHIWPMFVVFALMMWLWQLRPLESQKAET